MWIYRCNGCNESRELIVICQDESLLTSISYEASSSVVYQRISMRFRVEFPVRFCARIELLWNLDLSQKIKREMTFWLAGLSV